MAAKEISFSVQENINLQWLQQHQFFFLGGGNKWGKKTLGGGGPKCKNAFKVQKIVIFMLKLSNFGLILTPL